MSNKKVIRVAALFMCLVFLLVGVSAYADTGFSTPATVDEINMKNMSMKLTYMDPDSKANKQVVVYWTKTTEFIKTGPPPDMKEAPSTPEAVKKGTKLYVTIMEKGNKDGKLWLDRVRIKE